MVPLDVASRGLTDYFQVDGLDLLVQICQLIFVIGTIYQKVTDYSEVDMLRSKNKSMNFGAEISLGLPNWRAQMDYPAFR